jgi:polar amino acid transport system substrate-binding protein
MSSRKGSLAIAAVCFLAFGSALYGETFKVAIMALPTAETYKSVITAIVEATGNNVDIQIVPPVRTTYMVVNRDVDFSLPMLAMRDQAKIKALDYDYSNAVLYRPSFVLFTNKSKPIDIDELKKGNPKGYKIEVDISQVDSWEFKGLPSTNIEASLRKVASGAIDGFIHTEASTDVVLKTVKLPTLNRQFYADVDSIFPLAKGTKGGKIDAMIASGIKKLKESGKFDQIMGPMIDSNKYNDWQP